MAETNIILQSTYTPIKKEGKKSRNPHTSGKSPPSGGGERVSAGTYHCKLISVQVPVLVDVTEVPDLQGKSSKA